MTWGNNGAGPLGVPPIGPPASVNSPMVGQQGNAYPPFYLASFESVMAAVSRGEVSLNMIVGNGSWMGGLNNAPSPNGANQAGNPTLMQAISQGPSQNGTNGINGVAAGGGTVNASYASFNTSPGTFDNGFDSTAAVDPKRPMNDATVSVSNPIQYGGN